MAKSTQRVPAHDSPIAKKGVKKPKTDATAPATPSAFHGPATPYARTGKSPKVTKRKRTPAEQRAEIERVAREHGADLSEEGFNEVLKKVGRKP